jgi:uncharacterized protein YjbI with pentapeptide repeats
LSAQSPTTASPGRGGTRETERAKTRRARKARRCEIQALPGLSAAKFRDNFVNFPHFALLNAGYKHGKADCGFGRSPRVCRNTRASNSWRNRAMVEETRNTAVTPQSPSDQPPGEDRRAAAISGFTARADDPDKLEAALVAAASMASNIWVLFLSFGTYLIVAVGSVTHRQLFLEDRIRLPLLNVDLPMVAFFVVAPVLFLIFHVYLLLHLKLMADKVRRYSDLVDEVGLTKIVENRVRLQLPDFVFVQFLAGPHEGRKNLTEWLLISIAWITVVIGPLALLLLTQLQFLPYHLAWATWAQRAFIVLDIALLWWFWPDILPRIGVGRGPFLRRIVATIVSTALIGFSIAIATFPGEAVYENWIARNIQIPETFVSKASTPPLLPPHIEKQLIERLRLQYPARPQRTTISLTKYLLEGTIDELKPPGWFSNSLVLPDQELVDTDTLQKIVDRQEREGKQPWQSERTKILRGRDLRGAWLNGADLRRIDLTGAQLQGASLWNVRLQGALLDRAQLQGASLYMAHLQGASFGYAQLQDATLDRAQLQAAALAFAHLQGASLNDAQLQGAILSVAQLQGASLNRAQMQGASLVNTELQGASLNGAQLQGVEFANTRLDYSDLRESFVWRSSRQQIVLVGADLAGMSPDPVSYEPNASLLDGVDNKITHEQLLRQFFVLRPDNPDWPSKRDEENAKYWSEQVAMAAQRSHQEMQDALASFLIGLSCADEGAPYVARGLIRNGRVAATGRHAAEIEQKLLNPKTCPGAVGLSDFDQYQLRAIVEENKSPRSAPVDSVQ